MSAIAADLKPADPSTHDQDPESMSKFVAKNVNDDWARQFGKERDQPKDRAQREKPKLFTGPQTFRNGGARKHGEESLRESGAEWQEKDREDRFDPARRDHERIGQRT